MQLDIIVPTIKGREESLNRCRQAYLKNTSVEFNFIVVPDSTSAGEGWIEGMRTSVASYVHLTNDDIEPINEGWFEACKEAADAGILPCPVVHNPDGSIQSCGGELNAPDDLIQELKPDWTKVDFTTVPFMSREQWNMIGMIPVHYCSDVWVSYRGRIDGIETVVRRDYELVHHNHEVGRGAGMPQPVRSAVDRQVMRNRLRDASDDASEKSLQDSS